jgi:hypothetical protein
MTLRGRLLGCALFLGVTLVPAVTAERPLLATHDALDEGGSSEQVVQLEQSVRQRTLLHRMLLRPAQNQRRRKGDDDDGALMSSMSAFDKELEALDAGEEVDDDELKQIDAQELEQEEGEEEEEEFDLEDIADVPEFTLEEIDGVSVSTVDVQERLGAGSSIDVGYGPEDEMAEMVQGEFDEFE